MAAPKVVFVSLCVCILACSVIYLMPHLQDKLSTNSNIRSLFSSIQALYHDQSAETVTLEEVNVIRTDAKVELMEQEAQKTDHSETEKAGQESKERIGEVPDKDDVLPVYPDYSEVSTYMLSAITCEEDEDTRSNGMRKHGFNEFVSENIGFHRNIPDERNEVCKSQSYPRDLPVVSVVICFYNEAWSTLLRSVHSILDKTPPRLVKEILLIDDKSDMEHLKKDLDVYVSHHFHKVRLIRSEERLGLIRARMLGARQATGDVLVFLDSHIEVNVQWLEPLLTGIKDLRRAVVVPFVDTIDAETFVYIPSPLVRGGFTWSLLHNWDALPPSYKLHEKKMSAEPIESPTMPGGLFAMERDYFFELGEYDDGMEIWGGENVEISFRIWQCGGRLEIIPCSRVAHVFRSFRPYSAPAGKDTATYNAARVAEVWLDDYKKHFYELRPLAKTMDIGNITKRVELRQKLGCKSFQWYLENIYPQMRVPGEEPKVSEHFRHPTESRPLTVSKLALVTHSSSKKCVAPADKDVGKSKGGKGGKLTLVPCSPKDKSMTWEVSSNNGRGVKLAGSRLCLEVAAGKTSFTPVLQKCHGSGGAQTWVFTQQDEESQAFHPASGRCLTVVETTDNKEVLAMDVCRSVPEQSFAVSLIA